MYISWVLKKTTYNINSCPGSLGINSYVEPLHMLHRPLSYNFKNNVASHRPDRLSRWRRLLMARQACARAQSRPKPTLEGGQSLFRRAGGVWDARRRHIGGGEKGAEAHSRCCAARSQTVGCTHRLCSFSGSMGRLMPARPAARR